MIDKKTIDNPEYVIYCRKSTDESSGKQVQSIPDQIRICVKYAKDNGLIIKDKPENFEFETEQDIIKEDTDVNISSNRIYKETRDLYIIKEQKSAKTPGKRPKWKKLMRLIDQGKIKGLLSYSPDRQARNMMEGGELINFVDNQQIDLKYTNFHFEDTASGKMMLGIWFVFSKQYSDKLSEDTNRGMDSKMNEGKALGTYKHGYMINDDGYHEPHPEYFDLRKEAFRQKREENKSDAQIMSWLRKKGYVRVYKKKGGEITKTIEFKGKNMGTIWSDPFYYGLFKRGDLASNLNETNPYYKPLINEEEHQILIEKHYENKPRPRKKVKDEHYHIMPLPEGFIKTPDGYSLTFNIPNKKKRFQKKLDQLRLKNPDATLADVVAPHQIHYRCAHKLSKYYGLTIKYDAIERAIIKIFENLKIDKDTYEIYKSHMKENFEKKQKIRIDKKQNFQLQYNRTKSKLDRFTLENMSIDKDEKETELYIKERVRLQAICDSIQADIDNIDDKTNNDVLIFEAFFGILNGAADRFKKLNYVQKRKIVSLRFLNITIRDDGAVDIGPNEFVRELIPEMGRSTGLEPATFGTTNRRSTS